MDSTRRFAPAYIRYALTGYSVQAPQAALLSFNVRSAHPEPDEGHERVS